jgi:hypothetical protein
MNSVLFYFTLAVDFCATAVSFWLALYLLAKGFPDRITLRAMIVLLALSCFFLSASINLFVSLPGATSLRAVFLVAGMTAWYSLTCQLVNLETQQRLRWYKRGVYLLGGVTALLLLGVRNAFIGEQENQLWVGRMQPGLPFILYSIFLLLAAGGSLYNLLADRKLGLSLPARSLLLASLFPLAEIFYGVLALAILPPSPRLIQDLLFFAGVVLFGVAVSQHQVLVQRRTTSLDLPVSGVAVLGLSALYAGLAWFLGMEPQIIVAAAVVAILTHSIYDMVREFLERARIRQEIRLRRQLHQLESQASGADWLLHRLQEGLDLLCATLDASGGFIAIRQDEAYVVQATNRSLPLASQLPPADVACEDPVQPASAWLPAIAWIAPAFEVRAQVAVVGVCYPATRLRYSTSDLDLLAEVADLVGVLVTLSRLPVESSGLAAGERPAEALDPDSSTRELLEAMTGSPPPEMVRMVEDALRNLQDYIALGQLPLADRVAVSGDSHVERGKRLHQVILEAIDALRPAGPRPREPLPRLWYNYGVLYDAYVECAPNREIMARLYISEGTFNRTRRKALRSLTRLLLEQGKLTL